jgi:hypothetical protein
VPDLHFITKLGLHREERVPHMALRLVKMHLMERERGRGRGRRRGGIVRFREREGGREKGQGGERKEKERGIKRGS